MALSNGVDFYRASKFDWFFISIILFFSLASFLWITHRGLPQSSQARKAIIYHKGSLLETVELGKDKIITILNGQMQVEAAGGRIRVLKADCPQHICLNMGWIQYGGQTIACVPNKVVIELASNGAPLLDTVVY